jgi:HAE1 family hydrophobic/amphiphilic exporter-1
MTSLAFILGVLPLAVAVGAGAEMRQSLGTAVFCGMLGVTLFGLLFTPIFYVVCRRLGARGLGDHETGPKVSAPTDPISGVAAGSEGSAE